jgi:type I restriction enzyme S subunit
VSWETVPLRALIRPNSQRNRSDLPLLSVVRDKGVIIRKLDKSDNHNVIPEDLSNYKVVSSGYFVMNKMKAWQGSCGVSLYDGIVSPAYFVFDLQGVQPRFFNYAIRSRHYVDEFNRISKGIRVDQWDLDLIHLKYIRFPIPPLPEQDQIVRYLDWKVSGINRLINAKKKQISLLQEQKRAVVNEAVMCGEEIRLGNLGSFRKGYGGSRADDDENGVACIRYGDIYRCGRISLSEPITRINQQVTDSYAIIHKGELLFALSGETKEEIGQALVNDIDDDTWVSGDAGIFTANDRILPYFLTYALRCPYVVAQRASVAKGDIIVHISTGALRRIRIIVPTIPEQEAIVAHLDKQCSNIEKIIEKINTEITLLGEYRTRLISDVVTGKLGVQGVEVPQHEAVEVVGEEEVDEEVEGEE